MTKDDGAPAFPRPRDTWPDPDNPAAADIVEEQDGMSLLDHFAGLALPLTHSQVGAMPLSQIKGKGYRSRNEAVAVEAYALAQAFVDVRSKWLAEEITLTDDGEAVPQQIIDPDCDHRWREVMDDKGKAYMARCVHCGSEAGPDVV